MAVPLTYPPFRDPMYNDKGVMNSTWVQFFERLYQTIAVSYGVVGSPASIPTGQVMLAPAVTAMAQDATISSIFYDPSGVEDALSRMHDLPMVSVKDKRFGAKGDGTTDDTEAIQAAILACAQSGSETYDGGGILFFPPGVYLVTTLQGNWGTGKIIIQGSGEFNTCIIADGDHTVLDLSDMTECGGIHIRDITIKNTFILLHSGTGHAIHIKTTATDDAYDIVLSNVRITDSPENGIYIENGYNVVLDMVHVDRCNGTAIYIGETKTTNLRNCHVNSVAYGSVAYRIESGNAVLQSCHGMDTWWAGWPSSLPTFGTYWGHFGNHASGLNVRATFIGCTIKNWIDGTFAQGIGLYFEENSSANFFSTEIIGIEDSPNLRGLVYDGVPVKHLPVFDSLSSITNLGGTSTWNNNSPIESAGAPFMLMGYNYDGDPADLEQYYDTTLVALQDLPKMTSFQNTANDSGVKINNFSIDQGEVTTSTYLPTLTIVAGVDSATPDTCQWSRIGDVVIVSGKITIDPTVIGTQIEIGVSLPIASNLAAATQCAGSVINIAVAGSCYGIQADAANNRANIIGMPAGAASRVHSMIFQYLIV